MKTSPKQATSLVMVKKKKKKKISLHFAHTHKYHPESIHLLHCIYYCFYILWSVLVQGLQNNRTYTTIGRGSRKNKPNKPATTNIYKRLYRKTSPKKLLISGLSYCEAFVHVSVSWSSTHASLRHLLRQPTESVPWNGER